MPPASSKRRAGSALKTIQTAITSPADPWTSACRQLADRDPKLARLIERHGPCLLRPRPRSERLGTIVRAILGQQISARVASTLHRRLREAVGSTSDAQQLLQLGESGLRDVGLSGVKARYVLNVAQAVHEGQLDLDRLDDLDDEAAITAMTTIKGVGRWTAEMVLIFALGRADVLPVGDLGIRLGIRDHHHLDEVPDQAECQRLAEPWRPYRTVAMWYLWRHVESTGSSTKKPVAITLDL